MKRIENSTCSQILRNNQLTNLHKKIKNKSGYSLFLTHTILNNLKLIEIYQSKPSHNKISILQLKHNHLKENGYVCIHTYKRICI